jgi:hypothetical protein
VLKYPNDGTHGRTFKRIERRMLRYFGMEPRYSHAYVKRLLARKDGRTLWWSPHDRAMEMMREERARIAAEIERVESEPTFREMREDLREVDAE